MDKTKCQEIIGSVESEYTDLYLEVRVGGGHNSISTPLLEKLHKNVIHEAKVTFLNNIIELVENQIDEGTKVPYDDEV